MSGGVDSSVAALLLQKEGYEVVGAYMKQWSDATTPAPSSFEEGRVWEPVCPWKEDRRDAMRVAAHLGIPFITLDFEKEYKAWVMEYMFKEYEAGRTPNPDVMCNKFIKFGVWLSHAREFGFDFLATGHYARQQSTDNRQQTVDGRPSSVVCLLEAKDKEKDQTYFLHQLTQEQLAHTLFPIGNYTKKEVREIAKKAQLPTAERSESMGICFVGEVPMKDFLQTRITQKRGRITLSPSVSSGQDGTVIGEHEGLAFYTIGQRHLGQLSTVYRLQTTDNRSPSSVDCRPVYVVEKNFEKNELVVGYEDDPLMFKKEIEVSDMHWISGKAPELPFECEVRLRHRQSLQKAEVRSLKSKDRLVIVEFDELQRAVTPGQFAVFYGKEIRLQGGAVAKPCLGGGVIE